LGGDQAVVGGLRAVAGSLRPSGDAPGSFVGFVLTVAGRAVTGIAVDVTCRVIPCFGLSIAQLGRYVALLRSQPGVPAPDPGKLGGPGVLSVARGLGAILSRNHPVIGGQCAVARGLGPPRCPSRTFIRLMLAVAGGAGLRAPVEVTRRVIARLGVSVTQLGREVALVRGLIAVTPFDVAVDRDRKGRWVRIGGEADVVRALPGALPGERLFDGFRGANVAGAP